MKKESTVNANEAYEETDLIIFEEGLFGFETYKKFLPLAIDEDSDAALCLQSVEEETLSFVVMNPFVLCSSYEPVLSKQDKKKLGQEQEEELSYYVICVIRDTAEDSSVNLRCPIVVNTVTRKAAQIILEEGNYSLRHPLKEFSKER